MNNLVKILSMSELNRRMLKASPDWLFGAGSYIMGYIENDPLSWVSHVLLCVGAYFYFTKRHHENVKIKIENARNQAELETLAEQQAQMRAEMALDHEIAILDKTEERNLRQQKVDEIRRERELKRAIHEKRLLRVKNIKP